MAVTRFLDNIAPRLSSPRRLILLNLLALLAIIACFILFISQQTIAELNHRQREEVDRLELVAVDLHGRLQPLLADVRILADSQRVAEHLRQPSPDTLAALTDRFRAAVEHRVLYAQLRLLNSAGQELARVDRLGDRVIVLEAEALQDKADRYYVSAGQALAPDEVYISPLDLNIENGRIEYPLNPTLRAVAPVYIDQQLQGLVVINYRAEGLLQQFALNMSNAWGEAMLLDADGYWLHSPHPRERFGFQLDHGDSFARRFAQAWTSINKGKNQQIDTELGWFGAVTLSLGEGHQTQRWYAVSWVPAPVFLNTATQVATYHLSTLGLVMLLGLGAVSSLFVFRLREVANQRRFEELVALQPDAVVVHRRDRLVYWNQAAQALLGSSDQELEGLPVLNFIAPEFHDLVGERIQRVRQAQHPRVQELEVLRADGTRVPVESRGTLVNFDGKTSVLAILTDISGRRENQRLREQLMEQIRRELRHSEERLRLALQSAPVSVYQQDRELRYVWVANLSDDATLATLIGQRDRDILSADEATRVETLKRRVLENGQGLRDEVMMRINGRDRWFQISAEAFRDEEGLIVGLAGAAFDITMYRQQERQLAYRNNYDPLTDLPNRTLMVDRLKQLLRHARRHTQEVAVAALDINRFKHINNNFGFAMGDLLLQKVSHRLRGALRAEDTVSRIGGDRFVLLFQPSEQQHSITTVTRKVISLFDHPFDLREHELSISGCLGISIFPRDGTDADALLSHAEIALQQARSSPQLGTFRFYDTSLDAVSSERLQLENALRRALENEEIHLLYQPQLDLRTRRVVAVEALARWNDPQRGNCPPSVFVPLAEESELIQKLGDWVLTQACLQQRAWEAQGLPLNVAVNLSSHQLAAGDLLPRVSEIITRTGVKASNLELEITETVLMENLEQVSGNLEGLRQLGIRLAVDDFGTGYSSLSYLHRLPVHCLKIDQSFVEAVEQKADSAAIVRAIIAMAHALRLEVVAEGVETQGQLDLLTRERCDLVQGYFLARPLAADQLATFSADYPGRDGTVIPLR